MKNNILEEVKFLHGLGFAVHWLHPKSKRPLESGWTTGERKSLKDLESTYRPGLNVGVRLGSPSKTNGGYLAVIDVDIKSGAKSDRSEAEKHLGQILSVIKGNQTPIVSSGRGLGSRHVYCVTEAPFKTFTPFRSTSMVKVHMPSKSPSKREMSELTLDEIKAGMRISPAWEISLYSEGRQVVLPPSIHPDSGKPYVWEDKITAECTLGVLRTLDVSILQDIPGTSSVHKKEGGTFEQKNRNNTPSENLTTGRLNEKFEFSVDASVDINWMPNVSEALRDLIVDGIWRKEKITDRSAYLLPAAAKLLKAGHDKNTILNVLTDRTTYLGECAFDHRKTNDRTQAAEWVWKYTLKKVMDEHDPSQVFKPIISFEGSEDAEHWSHKLEKMGKSGMLRPSLNNCKLIITNVCDIPEVVGRNDFAVNDFYLCDTPWRSQKGDAVRDIDIVRIKHYCAHNFKVEFYDNIINQALIEIADLNRFHPIKSYLESLEWDGVPRLETWLQKFAGVTGADEYVKAVSRKVLVAMVKRIYEPGCKFDHVLILEGLQGTGKSTLLHNLADPWFSDETLNIGDKDAVLTMQSKWLIELGELSAFSKSEVELMKAFISRRTDRIRSPYGRRVEEFPRQCIFIGSTNRDEYLKDESGNRRFWPVKCGAIDFEGLKEMKHQLFAEAVAFYYLGEPAYLEDKDIQHLAKLEQSKRNESDEWEEAIRNILIDDSTGINPKTGFTMNELAQHMSNLGAHRLTLWDQRRISKCLHSLGYEKCREGRPLRRVMWKPLAQKN